MIFIPNKYLGFNLNVYKKVWKLGAWTLKSYEKSNLGKISVIDLHF